MTHFLGITVLPEYFQVEGVDSVISRCLAAGATAIATSPYVMREVSADQGHREPPVDAGAGKVRLLERPLWGKHELWVETTPSYSPDLQLYHGTSYRPPERAEWGVSQGELIDQIIAASHEAGLELYFQVQAAIPPGYRVQFGGPSDEDAPRMFDNRIPEGRVAKNASLVSYNIRNYQTALLKDLTNRYPLIDGVRLDWPEYPPYRLDSIFVDFSTHMEEFAVSNEISLQEIKSTVSDLYSLIHRGLSNDDLEVLAGSGDLPAWLVSRGIDIGLLTEWFSIKALAVSTLLNDAQETLTENASPDCRLIAHAFPPPWSRLSGMHFKDIARCCDGIAVKLYTMHWSMMLRYYLDQIHNLNPELSEELLIKVLYQYFKISDDPSPVRIMDVKYPGPEDLHARGPVVQADKIIEAQREAVDTPVYALIHGYGTVDDFSERFVTAFDAANGQCWLNRYGYLGDSKLSAIGNYVRARKSGG